MRKPRRTSATARVRPAWDLIWGQSHVDSRALAVAIENDLQQSEHPDFRTRLLVRDAASAIRSFWGARRFLRWLDQSPASDKIKAILDEDLGEPGFPNIRRRLVDSIHETQVKQIFDLVGRNIHDRVEIYVAGSIPTLIKGLTARPTEDIDIVNEVPPEIRKQRAALEKIKKDYGLSLGHVQSHYLPAHWENRRQYLGDFGGLRVYLVDVCDIFVSKLSSKQEKHKDDLRVLAQKLDKEKVKERLLGDGQAFLQNSHCRPQIEENWRFIYQEPLFPGQTDAAKAVSGETGPKKTNRRKPKSR